MRLKPDQIYWITSRYSEVLVFFLNVLMEDFNISITSENNPLKKPLFTDNALGKLCHTPSFVEPTGIGGH